MDDDLLKELARLREENIRLKAGDEPKARKGSPVDVKPWVAMVFDGKGEVLLFSEGPNRGERIEKTFWKASEADRWVDLRLVKDGFAGCYGTIGHKSMRVLTTIDRDAAMGRTFGRQPGKPGQMQPTKPNPEHKKMGFGVKCHQSRVEFSRG